MTAMISTQQSETFVFMRDAKAIRPLVKAKAMKISWTARPSEAPLARGVPIKAV
ncbi:hypothetical protein D3C78_1748320 [compost metagenome]